MHEMSLCLETIKLLEGQAEAQGYSKVTAVWLELGMFSCVEPEALRFCFSEAAKGSLVEGAGLHLHQPEGKAWCYDCGETVVVSQAGQACPLCDGYHLRLARQGESLKVKQIEVE